jgi:hypothetical protein
MPLDIGRVTHLTDQMHRSEDDSGDPIDNGFLLAADGARGHVWTDPATIGGGSVPWSYAQADGGLAGDGSTDDSAAYEAWMDTVTASGTQSGWFWFEPGTYLLSRALQSTGSINSQVRLPTVSTGSAQITLTFRGAARPPFAVHGPLPTPGGYSIIKSTLTGGTGTAAVISGGNGSYPGTQNNISVVVEDLICIAPVDPSLTFWNLAATQGGSIRNLYIATTDYNALPGSAPTHTNACGIKLPQVRNSNYTHVDGLNLYFYGTGLLQGELAIIRGLIISGCAVGVEFPGPGEHASLIVDMQVTDTPKVLKATGLHYCDILSYDFETGTGPGWSAIVYDLDDASNYLHGTARDYGYPSSHTFTKNGGTNFSSARIGALAAAVDLTAIDFLVGTASGLLSAEIAVGTTPGGELGNTWASPTVDTTHSGSSHAATQAAAEATAAAALAAHVASSGSGVTDHEHIGDIQFSGDGATTAFELPAAPFDAYSVQAYVAGVRLDVTLSGTLLTTMTFGSAPASGTNNIIVDLIAAAA